MEVQFHSFLASTLDGSECTASCLTALLPGGGTDPIPEGGKGQVWTLRKVEKYLDLHGN
jgi:hypothetical protein